MQHDTEKKNGNNYTLADCAAHARTHVAYGWTRRPWGHWGAYTIDLDDGERQIEFTGSADCARRVFNSHVERVERGMTSLVY